jgi:hypothetical protein
MMNNYCKIHPNPVVNCKRCVIETDKDDIPLIDGVARLEVEVACPFCGYDDINAIKHEWWDRILPAIRQGRTEDLNVKITCPSCKKIFKLQDIDL